MTMGSQAKKEFATRLSPETLARLDQLIRSGRFKSRTAAIEAAVERLVETEQREQMELQQAFERACGAFSLGVDRERWQQAELDRLDWEASISRATQRSCSSSWSSWTLWCRTWSG